MLSNKLSIPEDSPIPDTEIGLPFMFVANDAFLLRENIMKPFPHRQLSVEKETFNYRLSRARNSVECSFGRLAQMWRLLFRQIDEQPNTVTTIVKALSVLHNFIITEEPHRQVIKASETRELARPRQPTYHSIKQMDTESQRTALKFERN